MPDGHCHVWRTVYVLEDGFGRWAQQECSCGEVREAAVMDRAQLN